MGIGSRQSYRVHEWNKSNEIWIWDETIHQRSIWRFDGLMKTIKLCNYNLNRCSKLIKVDWLKVKHYYLILYNLGRFYGNTEVFMIIPPSSKAPKFLWLHLHSTKPPSSQVCKSKILSSSSNGAIIALMTDIY